MSIWFTAIPHGFEKLLELSFVSCLFFTNTMVYGFSLANCKRQKGCFPFWCIIWLLFFLRGNQNSLKNTLFDYYYFLIWAVLTILKPWVLNSVDLLIWGRGGGSYTRNSPPIQTKISSHLSDNSLPESSGLFFLSLKMEWSGNVVILRVYNVNSIFYFFFLSSSSQLSSMESPKFLFASCF